MTSEAPTTEENDCQPCHSLPCKIDFNGRAPVEVYFSPQEIPHEKNDDAIVCAAQFRGRQLLAVKPPPHQQTTMAGRLLEIDACKARNSEGKVRVKAKFNSILEWKHEHDIGTVQNNHSSGNSRVRTAMEWCDVAHALHDAIPI
ncbi:Ribonuclease H2 non-catalytic subunit (Ylr154p-like) [Seminavis robusta]|uniref:Ribonuclease H2 non-catalytic subunit (Ylr154p-like) n=1 Tax=Seminavis robusta TaxID=568900 RepID=A0A9N8E3N7_9STRA|nr:Ribonuclease H2 non-catalytic subunit (Ylr154p-like) [Seminavis robusta]|eukprot:Sro585_g170990.1 Ribonuclease H2 non-catalytic subunit (Ylr154p-like) (144) ;mRNA; f:22412-22990